MDAQQVAEAATKAEIENLLDEFDGVSSTKIVAEEIWNRIVGPLLDARKRQSTLTEDEQAHAEYLASMTDEQLADAIDRATRALLAGERQQASRATQAAWSAYRRRLQNELRRRDVRVGRG